MFLANTWQSPLSLATCYLSVAAAGAAASSSPTSDACASSALTPFAISLLSCATLASTLALVSPALAQAQPTEPTSEASADPPSPTTQAVETIVVTGSRGPQPLTEMPGAVEVVPGVDIEASRYDGVVDVLRHVPGIHVDQPGARGSRASIYTRGLDPNHTVVLLDGVR